MYIEVQVRAHLHDNVESVMTLRGQCAAAATCLHKCSAKTPSHLIAGARPTFYKHCVHLLAYMPSLLPFSFVLGYDVQIVLQLGSVCRLCVHATCTCT